MFKSYDDCESPLGVDSLDEGDDGGDMLFAFNSIPTSYFN